MVYFTGYKIIEEIFKGKNSTILRGTRNSDNYPVIIKLLNREYPSNTELSNFIREFEMINKIFKMESLKHIVWTNTTIVLLLLWRT